MIWPRAGILALVAFSVAACNGSSSDNDGGPGASAQQYYNLNPNLCFEYALTTTSPPEISITTVPANDGVEMHFHRRGNDFLIEHLTFDGGPRAFLETRSVVAGASKRTWQYETPLPYLQSNLTNDTPALIATSNYTEVLNTNPATHGIQQSVVSVKMEDPNWPSGGSDAGVDAFELQFSFTDVDDAGAMVPDAGQSNQIRWASPGIGYVGLLMEDSPGSGNFVKYYLTGAPQNLDMLDGGCL
jgi:hypothetical protein